MRALLTAAAMISLLACQAGETIDEPQTTTQAIFGGDGFTTEFAGVCGIRVELPNDPTLPPPAEPDYRHCTCTLVGPRMVVTAAQCLWDFEFDEVQIPKDKFDVRFGSDLGFESEDPPQHTVEKVELFRYFDDQGLANNIAMLLLDTDPAFPIMPLNERALTEADVPASSPDCYPAGAGDPLVAGCVTMIGFGETLDNLEDFGGRRRVISPLISVEDTFVLAGTAERTTCIGDTGGPAFMKLAENPDPVQISVNSGHRGCFSGIERSRVDLYIDNFIYAFVDQYDAQCGTDGLCCVTEGTCGATECRTPDPDCDPCAWSGETTGCEEECPTRDWDCELGSMPGELCVKDGDCEKGGRCVVAPDDETVSFCTMPCDPADVDGCPANMACDTSDSDGECIWVPPSPGSQGFTCNCPEGQTSCETIFCRSGICEEEICVVDCDPGAASPCPQNFADPDQPYTCAESKVISGRNVCVGEVFSGGGGFCESSSVTGRDRGGWGMGAVALFGLAFAGLFFARRRRRS